MQMIYCLATLVTCIDDKAVSLSELTLTGYLPGGGEQMPKQRCVCCQGMRVRGEMLPGDEQQVSRSDGLDVLEGETLVVLIDLFRRNLTGSDTTEETIGSHREAFYLVKYFGCWPGCHGS